MRVVARIFRAPLCAAFVLLVAGCHHSSDVAPSTAAEPGRNTGVDLQILVGPLERSRDDIENEGKVDYAYLDVRNDLDRSISVDFVGGPHYDLQVGDSGTGRVRLAEGSYTMAVSAPGLKPAKERISVSKERIYSINVYSRRAKD